MGPELRIIDANANRAREALRTMEDIARLALDHAPLAARLKELRHDLASALTPFQSAITRRDTAGDVGTAISTKTEATRASLRDVAVAAAKRLSEALRTLEETAKATDRARQVAPRIEAIRYRAYDIERDLTLAMGAGRAPQWTLCLLLTESLCTHHPWLDVARLAIEAGADAIQLREKTLDGAELAARTRALIDIARPAGASVIVNDRIDVALATGADAVHLGQTDLTVADARRIAGFDLLVGVSTTNLEQARQAHREGADYCGIGPMFPSTTKPKDHIAGPDYARQYLSHDPPLPPHLAIGGITPDNASELAAAGARGLAVSSAICSAADPAAACREILKRTQPMKEAERCAR